MNNKRKHGKYYYKKKGYRFKDEHQRRSYLDKLFTRIFLSSVCVLLAVTSNRFLNFDVKKHLNEHLNIVGVTNYLFGSFIPNFNYDKTVSGVTIYDSVEYRDGVNYINNQDQDAVVSYASGMVVSIGKQNNLYTLKIKGADGYLYTYKNLESIDCTIYEYIKAEKIIGRCPSGQFALLVSKNSVNYSLYEIHADA